MKKVILLIIAVLFIFATASCGHDTIKTTEPAPASWVGVWRGIDGDGQDKFVVDISANTIKIDWKMDNGDTSLYWLGTFEDLNKGSIISFADEDALEHSVFGSQSPTKEFINREGSLYFEVRAMGTTRQIHIEK